MTNSQEYAKGTNPNNSDTDGDGKSDATDQFPNDPNDGEWEMPSGVPVVHLYPAICSPQKAKQNGCPPRNATDFVAYQGGPQKPDIIAFVEEHAMYTPVWSAAAARSEL